MKFSLITFTILFSLFFSPAYAGREGITAVVNSDAVTDSDVNDRLNLIALSTGLPKDNKELVERLRAQIIEMLIDETLRLQEAKRLDIKVTDQEIEDGFKQIATNNNIPVDKFKTELKAQGIRLTTLQDQIRSQVAWGKVIQRQVRPKIEVNDADIDVELDQIKKNIGKTQYALSEILLTIDENRKEDDVRAFANRLVGQLREKPEAFPRVAREFSQAPGAAQGGLVGWVLAEQLPAELADAVSKMPDKSISDPIRTPLGFHILFLAERRNVTEELVPKREEILQRIGNERLERGARRYYQDVRSSAFIEMRNK